MELNIDLITLLGIACAAIAAFVPLYYLVRSKFRNDGYVYLYTALLLLSFEVLYKTLVHSRLMFDYPLLYTPGRSYNLLIYPVFLLFIRSVMKPREKIPKSYWLVLGGFIAYALYSRLSGMLTPMEYKRELLALFYSDGRPGPHNYWLAWDTLLPSTIIPGLFLAYIGIVFNRFRESLPSVQSARLYNFLTGIVLLYFLYSQLANLIYRWMYRTTDFSMIEWPVDILVISLISTLLVILVLSVNSGESLFPKAKYASSALSEEQSIALVEQARSAMNDQQLFKDHEVSLTMIAREIGANPKYLSQALNHHLQLNFVDFVNAYRIEEAKHQLLSEVNASLTFEAIGSMSGFRSKSTFFRAFKKATSLTPSQYVARQKGANA